jgi:hypothetical protein
MLRISPVVNALSNPVEEDAMSNVSELNSRITHVFPETQIQLTVIRDHSKRFRHGRRCAQIFETDRAPNSGALM